MRNAIILLIILSFYCNEICSQETISKDNAKNNYGLLLGLEWGFHAGFVQFGIDYNHRIDNRFSVGGAFNLGTDGHKNSCRKVYILPYFRVDLLKNKFSPFIDLGVGYDLTFWRTKVFVSQDNYNKYTSRDFFISPRLGLCLINKQSYSLSFIIQYQKFFTEGGYTGVGFIYDLKR